MRAKVFDVLDWSSNRDINNTQEVALLDNKPTEKASKEIVNIWERVLKAGHPKFANNINDTNYLDNTKQNYTQALSLYQQALDILQENTGEINLYKEVYEDYIRLKENIN
ncbi:MAG: hypothetical protein PHP00_00370 [Thiotrichaceae bacterium]|nr:hypothetical protein [Thiotrichaceae bacterium]